MSGAGLGSLKVDNGEIRELLRELVAIPSVNPAFPGGTGEAGVGEFVRRYCESLGIPVELQEVEPGRMNVIGMLNVEGAAETLLFEAHMDTVQATGMTIDPFAAEVKDGRLYGRGACDTKASLAAMLAAVAVLKRSGVSMPVSVHVAAVVDEEYTYKGVSKLADSVCDGERSYSAAVVGEPTGLHQIVAHKGCVRFHVEVQGVTSHSSNPAIGVNAIDRMRDVLEFLERHAATEYGELAHPLVGPPTHAVTEIRGGEAPNTIPGGCRITVDRRTVPGEEPLDVWEDMRGKLLALAEETPGLRLEVGRPFIVDYAMETDPESTIAVKLGEAVANHASGRAKQGAPYCTDASKLVRVGIPSVVFGPGDIRQAHTEDEWVELAEVEQAARALIDLVLQYGEE